MSRAAQQQTLYLISYAIAEPVATPGTATAIPIAVAGTCPARHGARAGTTNDWGGGAPAAATSAQ